MGKPTMLTSFEREAARNPVSSSLAASHAEKSYENALDVEKSKADFALIKHSIEGNNLFTCLDQHQIENFIKGCRLMEFGAGETIFFQGNKGQNFYVVAEGELDVVNVVDPTTQRGERVFTKIKGDNFGEGAFLFGRRHSATIIATTPVKLWVLDSNSLQNVLDSPQIRRIYDRFASRTDKDGTKYMTMQDFVRASTSSADPTAHAQIATLLRIFMGRAEGAVTQDTEQLVSLKDFTVFNALMTRPDPHFEIAFMLMDRSGKGIIGLPDLKLFLKDLVLPNGAKFRYDCDLVERFFGSDGSKSLRVSQFSAFFCQLQYEIGQQAFMAALRPNSAQLSASTFISLLSQYSGGDVPRGILDRLSTTSIQKEGLRGLEYTFGDFLAFQHLILYYPAISSVITAAARAKGSENHAHVSKDDFKMAAKVLLNPLISRLDADAVFQIFDLDKDGLINKSDLKVVLGDMYNPQLNATIGREGKLTLVPPPGSAYKAPSPSASHAEPAVAPSSVADRIYFAVKDFLEHFALGAIAGGIGATAVYPIDLIKTRLQNQRTSLAKGAVTTTLKDGTTLPYYKGPIDCLTQTVRREGVLGLYRGLLPQLVGVAPEKAIKLTVNDMLRDAFTNKDKVTGVDDIYFPLEVLAGCGAGASQVLFTNPLEIVKIRLQVQGETEAMMIAAGKALPPRQSALQIVKELGISGLYKGAPACLLRDVPFSGIYFPCYAWAKKWLAGDSGKLEPHHLLLAGALAGIPAASLVTPADVIKTRLQVVAREGEATYTGIGDAFTKIVSTEGVGALFKGALMRVVRSSPQFGVTLLAYELLYRFISPTSAPRPPTNVPIPWAEYDDAFRIKHVEQEAKSLWDLMRPLTGGGSSSLPPK